MLYTRKGDDGSSGLFGTARRLPKDSPVYEALGALDELNSLLGLCRACSPQAVATTLLEVQERLFVVQAELAGAPHSLSQSDVGAVERTIARLEALIKKPRGFVVAGSTGAEAWLDFARALARRAERAVVAAAPQHPVSPATRHYLNRLSSLLYALARGAAAQAGVEEPSPVY